MRDALVSSTPLKTSASGGRAGLAGCIGGVFRIICCGGGYREVGGPVGPAPLDADVLGANMPSAWRFARREVVLEEGVGAGLGGAWDAVSGEYWGGGTFGSVEGMGVVCLALAAEASMSAKAFELISD